jgi:hypothetical protein
MWPSPLVDSRDVKYGEGGIYNMAQDFVVIDGEDSTTSSLYARQVRAYTTNKIVCALEKVSRGGARVYLTKRPNVLRGCVRVYFMNWRRLLLEIAARGYVCGSLRGGAATTSRIDTAIRHGGACV